ncbi:MAG: N-acetylmuramoyl-L-alanine amidase [Rhodobacteraceae bacterium]|nr:MAG: N-acetylmuramoyl-L-alanine amidase [Paracoccaceae bacterium]
MSRFLALIFALFLGATAPSAQDLSGLARIDPAGSALNDMRGGMRLDLALSQGVPFRIFTLPDPDRLIIDFREVDWRGFEPPAFDRAEGASDVRVGRFRPGWSRMIVDLARPMNVALADMRVSPETGAAHLAITLKEVDRAAFLADAVPPLDPDWGLPGLPAPRRKEDGRLSVVIDPGHGGVDPGAERDGLNEKELMLLFAFDLRDSLLRIDGVDVTLTREDDTFVSLERRVAIAHQSTADVFISLHADTLTEGRANGAVVYTLSDEATDKASALLAERHDRSDILAGVDLTGSDDVVADVLLDLARLETEPRTEALAGALIAGLKTQGVPLNRHPHRAAAFSVLKAADIPSVLLEIGFISSDRDFRNLADPVWRRKAAAGLRDGLQSWIISDEAARALTRQ